MKRFLHSLGQNIAPVSPRQKKPAGGGNKNEDKESLLSLQQIAFKLFSVQQESTTKRKELHSILVEEESCKNEERKKELKVQSDKLRKELEHNEMLMANFEYNIAAGQAGVQFDGMSNCSAFERFLENSNVGDNSNSSSIEPIVVNSVKVNTTILSYS